MSWVQGSGILTNCLNDPMVLGYQADNISCSFLREMMTGGNTVALLPRIMEQELADVLLSEEFVAVAKEGMHQGTVFRGDVFLYPMVVWGIGTNNLMWNIYFGQFLTREPAGIHDYAGYSVERERNECSERTAHNEVYPMFTDVIKYLPASLGKISLRIGERLHRAVLGHKAFEHGACASLGAAAITIYVQYLCHKYHSL